MLLYNYIAYRWDIVRNKNSICDRNFIRNNRLVVFRKNSFLCSIVGSNDDQKQGSDLE